jgi:hypothetical protein
MVLNMITVPVARWFAAGALAASALVADEAAAPGAPAVSAEFFSATNPEAVAFARAGEAAINRLASQMLSELSSALARGGPEAALEVSHLKKVPATGAVLAGHPQITAFKRTSLRVRDAANKPDAADQIALAYIDRALSRGDAPPKLLIQRVRPTAGAEEWRVYRPLAVLPSCVQCHGKTETLPPGVRAALEKRYPEDPASGYAPGEWRGLLRVTVAPPAAPAAAPAAPR